MLFDLQSKVFATGVSAVPLDAAKEHRDEMASLRLSSCFLKIKGPLSIFAISSTYSNKNVTTNHYKTTFEAM